MKLVNGDWDRDFDWESVYHLTEESRELPVDISIWVEHPENSRANIEYRPEGPVLLLSSTSDECETIQIDSSEQIDWLIELLTKAKNDVFGARTHPHVKEC